MARKQFRFASNRLDHLLRDLKIGEKVRHDGHELWVRCMAKDKAAWADMERYNRGDVDQLEDAIQHHVAVDHEPSEHGLVQIRLACLYELRIGICPVSRQAAYGYNDLSKVPVHELRYVDARTHCRAQGRIRVVHTGEVRSPIRGQNVA